METLKQMYVLFTKSKNWFSALICKVTGEPVSHVSILDPVKQVVYQSSFRGVETLPTVDFLLLQDKVIFYSMPELSPYDVQEKFDKYDKSWYDIGALLFLGISLILRRYLKLPLPKSNLWQATGMFLCTEWVMEVIELKEKSAMITPYKLYQELLLNDTRKLETDPTRH